MHSFALLCAASTARLPRLSHFAATSFAGHDARYAMVIAFCMAAVVVSLLVWTRVPKRSSGNARHRPLGSIAAASVHIESLIEDLLHCAKLAHREGVASLSHPFRHSADVDVAYAMNLVADEVDPRIVRGILLDRLADRTGGVSGCGTTLGSRRAILRRGGILFIGVAACGWWQLGRFTGETSPALAAMVLVAWCIGGVAWLAASCWNERTGHAEEQSSVQAVRWLLILTAAELIARGDGVDVISRRLRSIIGETERGRDLARAA